MVTIEKYSPAYYTYEVTVNPTTTAITPAEVRAHAHINIDPSITDEYITLIIKAATAFAEKYTKRTFINTTFKTYRDYFSDCIELRRSKFQSLVSFKYFVHDLLFDVDTNLYYVTHEKDYSKIILHEDETYPTDIENKVQAIEIEFVAGYGTSGSAFPSDAEDLKIALLNHVTYLFENKGDCDLTSMENIEDAMPNTTRLIYQQHRIIEAFV